MGLSLAATAYDGFPVVIPSGTITVDNLVELGKFVRETCDNAGARGVVIDCKLIEVALPTESLYRVIPEFLKVVGRRVKVGYIDPPKSWPLDNDQFSRDLVYNRGGLLEHFETMDDAVDWLRQP